MTLGKLKELLEVMTESQLKKEVVIHTNQIDMIVKSIQLLRDEESGRIYPALVA
jgi:hypothetical protein